MKNFRQTIENKTDHFRNNITIFIKNLKLARDIHYSKKIVYLKNCEIHFLTKT